MLASKRIANFRSFLILLPQKTKEAAVFSHESASEKAMLEGSIFCLLLLFARDRPTLMLRSNLCFDRSSVGPNTIWSSIFGGDSGSSNFGFKGRTQGSESSEFG